MHVCMYVCMCIPFVPEADGDQKEVLDPRELEVYMVVSCHWVLGIKPTSSARATSVNCKSEARLGYRMRS